eukprot:gnl/TRDRNA2_/TRDRNA2_201416_c0_seq1.p1 gnl/TRDRNA2_/TRDRNA2_201416_c0~~gnl/TRDRNA2_/TRDRNA2_201416_c0_seq1.p1  ORF type:complete len:141 (+),score=4.26 gnl/TRDRNA2_/TRDRNA2_201416_c0_seq1:25-447(+)
MTLKSNLGSRGTHHLHIWHRGTQEQQYRCTECVESRTTKSPGFSAFPNLAVFRLERLWPHFPVLFHQNLECVFDRPVLDVNELGPLLFGSPVAMCNVHTAPRVDTYDQIIDRFAEILSERYPPRPFSDAHSEVIPVPLVT